MAKIGFVGLGHMGLPMATHLVQAGHQVTGYDLNPKALSDFCSIGGLAVDNLEHLFPQETFITMLQTGSQVKAVCLAEHGLFAKAPKNSLFIDCSSIDVKSSRELAAEAKKRQLAIIDAPVSGGMLGAIAATLTFLVGGLAEDLERARPLLSLMGKKIIHTGPSGNGQVAKICNNMILGISMIGISEAFVLAEKLGLSAQNLFEVVSNSSGQCWAMSHYCPAPNVLPNVPANNHYEPGFATSMMLKDLHLSQNCAEEVQVNTPLGHCATELYQQFYEKGNGQLDFSAIIQAIAKKEIDLC